MSRDSYDYGGRGGGRGGDRWDTERFQVERERARYATEPRDRFEERESHFSRGGGGYGAPRPRERSGEEIYEHRGPARGFEEDRYERREYYDDEPRLERERPLGRERGQSITIEKEKEYYSPSPPRRAPARPGFLRRQSSLDTFDRRPMGAMTRFEREEYGPPARYRPEEARLPVLTPIPLPRRRELGPPTPRRYAERDYEEIRVAEPDFYGDEEYRGFPERVREREIVRRRRRSHSRSRSRGESKASHSVRSSSSSSGTSERSGTTTRTAKSSKSMKSVRSEFPKKGKTRMPARLVNKRAIIDLNYPFEEEGDVIIIQKALGRENIDEVIKLSEDYNAAEKAEMSGARSESGHTVYEEHKTEEVYAVPAAPASAQGFEVVTDTKVVERSPSPAHSHYSHHPHAPIIIEARGPPQSDFVTTKHTTYVEHSDPMPVGPLALALPADRGARSSASIRAEIKALEAEKEALRAEKRADRELRKADRIRRGGGRVSESDLVLYERDVYETPREDYTVVRRDYIEPDGGVKVVKDKKVHGQQAKAIRAMLKTLT